MFTLTIDLHAWIQPSEAYVYGLLVDGLGGSVKILSVGRSLFSGRFVVVYEPLAPGPPSAFRDKILSILRGEYPATSLVSMDPGFGSPSPGGLEGVSKTASEFTHSLSLPLLLLSALVVVVLIARR